MAIPFDFRALERKSAEIGDILAGGILRKVERKREREDWEKKQDYLLGLKKEEMEAKHVIDKDLLGIRTGIEREELIFRTEYGARLGKFGGDPEFAKYIKDQMSSNTGSPTFDSIRRTTGAAVLTAWTRMKGGEVLTDEEMAIFKQLPDQSQATIAELHNANKVFTEELRMKKEKHDQVLENQRKNMEYLDALILSARAGKARDPMLLLKDKETYTKKIKDIVGSDSYQNLARAYRESTTDEKTGKNTLDKMTPEQQTEWLLIQKTLQADKTVLYAIEAQLRVYGMGDPIEEDPMIREVEEMTEGLDNPFEQRMAEWAEERQMSIVERGLGKKQTAKLEKRITKKEIKKLKKATGIKEKIYSSADIPALRDAGADSVGKYVYHPDPTTGKPTLYVVIADESREGGLALKKIE